MRGVFTAGVLDAFMKHEIYFRHVVAVSAGAGNGLSYMSRQPRRAHVCDIDLLTKYDTSACVICSPRAASSTPTCSTSASPTS